MKNKRLVIFAVLCLLFGSILSTVHAEELEEIEATETELFASAQELSAEEVCELLKADDSIQQVSAFNNDVYYIDNHTLYRYDTTSDKLAVAYAGEIEVNYFIPRKYGVLIGTKAPINKNGQAHTELENATDLTWSGEYYFYNYSTGELLDVDNPDWTLMTATTDYVEDVSFGTTTINGKTIPAPAYPVGDPYDDADHSSKGIQCQGFGYGIIKYLYGDYDNVNEVNIDDILSATQIKTYNLGSMIRANTTTYKHTMILIGYDDGGIYVYHANWDGANTISISYVKNAAFESDGCFPSIDYILEHSHSYGSWRNHSSTQHSHSCTTCAYTEYKSHSVSTWSYYSTVQHKGTCSTCSGVVYQTHTYNSSGSCTKCGPSYINRKITTAVD